MWKVFRNHERISEHEDAQAMVKTYGGEDSCFYWMTERPGGGKRIGVVIYTEGMKKTDVPFMGTRYLP